MSKRATHSKKIRKLERALRKAGSPQASIDLIEWLKLHKHADTTGDAIQLLLDGKVRVDSHVVGRQRVPSPFKKDEEVWGVAPLIGSYNRSNIVVDD